MATPSRRKRVNRKQQTDGTVCCAVKVSSAHGQEIISSPSKVARTKQQESNLPGFINQHLIRHSEWVDIYCERDDEWEASVAGMCECVGIPIEDVVGRSVCIFRANTGEMVQSYDELVNDEKMIVWVDEINHCEPLNTEYTLVEDALLEVSVGPIKSLEAAEFSLHGVTSVCAPFITTQAYTTQ
jgi:hypothetical protein